MTIKRSSWKPFVATLVALKMTALVFSGAVLSLSYYSNEIPQAAASTLNPPVVTDCNAGRFSVQISGTTDSVLDDLSIGFNGQQGFLKTDMFDIVGDANPAVSIDSVATDLNPASNAHRIDDIGNSVGLSGPFTVEFSGNCFLPFTNLTVTVVLDVILDSSQTISNVDSCTFAKTDADFSVNVGDPFNARFTIDPEGGNNSVTLSATSTAQATFTGASGAVSNVVTNPGTLTADYPNDASGISVLELQAASVGTAVVNLDLAGGDCAGKSLSYNVTVNTAPGAVCGNNTVEVGEQCDDGNTNDGDGCSSTCFSENNRRRSDRSSDAAVVSQVEDSSLQFSNQEELLELFGSAEVGESAHVQVCKEVVVGENGDRIDLPSLELVGFEAFQESQETLEEYYEASFGEQNSSEGLSAGDFVNDILEYQEEVRRGERIPDIYRSNIEFSDNSDFMEAFLETGKVLFPVRDETYPSFR